MNEEKFTELIRRYQAGDSTEEENALVEKWLSKRASENMFSKFATLEKEEVKENILQGILGRMSSEKKGHRIPMVIETGSWLFRAAAAVLLLLASSYLVWQLAFVKRLDEVAILQTSAWGQVEKVMLTDGSIVWLKNRSTLTYPDKFTGNERSVELTGEALFEIAKDPTHPFIIQCGELTAKVLGTSFNMKASEEGVEVMVLTGKVALSSAHDRQDVVVMPNEKAVYNSKAKRIAKVVAEEKETTTTVAGTEYNMHFEDTRMIEVIQRIEGKFNVQVTVEDTRIYECLVTANFTDQSLQNTLDIVAKVLAVQYEMNDNKINLKGAGCQ